MEPQPVKNNTAAPRKMKYAPKAPIRRRPKPEVKAEANEEEDSSHAKELLRRFNERNMNAKLKVEKKASAVHVAFGQGGASNSLRSYGISRAASSSTPGSAPNGGTFAPGVEKEYEEPWNYYSYYPVTHPLRRPYSGNPELLDAEEFGEASENTTFDENTQKPAIELGLMEDNPEASMFFLQLPSKMPMIKRSANVKGQEGANNSGKSSGSLSEQKSCSLDDLPAGFMGKMLVYKSGAVKLKLGDTLFDVTSGMDCTFSQDVAAINTSEKCCCVVGQLNKRAILTPDVDFVTSYMADL